MPATALQAPLLRSNFARIARLIFGDAPVQRRAIKRLFVITNAYILVWLLLGVTMGVGYAPARGWWVVAYGAAGLAVFYGVLRSGVTLSLKDPQLCFAQALFGAGAVVLGYALIPHGQGPALQTLFVILVFDLHRLSSRQLAFVASITVAMLAVLVLAKWHFDPAGVDLRQEALNLSMAGLVVPLLSTINGRVKQLQARQMAQKAELDRVLGELNLLSKRDAMTGAVNRRYMLELLDDELKRQRRNHAPFSVAMLDIDNFKHVNDNHGHAVGDMVLKQIAAIAVAVLRTTDVLSRWGGEEFLVLLPESSAHEAGIAIEQLRKQVALFDWTHHAPGLTITFSGGVAEHALAVSLEQTIAMADGALYRAKNLGRNRVERG